MKPGDLIKLLSASLGSVTIGTYSDFEKTWLVGHGTAALFLDNHDEDSLSNKRLMILVEGRFGWIYVDECEVLSEDR